MIGKRILKISMVLIAILIFNRCSNNKTKVEQNLIQYVNLYVGTAPSTTPSILKHKEAASEAKGQTIPAIGFPYASTNWTAQTQATETKCIAPYYYTDSLFQGFRASHWMSGSCTQDYGSVTIMPLADELIIDANKRASLFSHETEKLSPASYEVILEDYGINAQVTGKIYSGILQFKYMENKEAYFVIEPNSDEGEAYIKIDTDKNEIIGYNPAHRIYQGWGESAGFSGYFVIQFQNEFTEFGTWKDDDINKSETESIADGKKTGCYVRVKTTPEDPVLVRVGTSFTSLENARKNLEAEIDHWDFDKVKQEAEDEWNNTLAQIQVQSTDVNQKTVFYTAMYHAKLLPRIFSDIDGSYVGFAEDSTIHTANGYNYYVDFTTWDSYRGVQPLMTIIDPQRSLDIVKSIVDKAEQGGWLPIFPCWNNYTSGMVGDHMISVIGDAYVKGIGDFDIEKAYKYMYQNAFKSPRTFDDYADGKGRRALTSYKKYGYIPMEDQVNEAFHTEEQISRTLEYAYDDFVLAEVAKKMGNQEDYDKLIERATNYKNVYDSVSGYMRGRYKNGSWIEEFNPNKKSRFITEGTPFQYTWYVPQDIAGLMELMGGKEAFSEKLDLFFDTEEYWHGNEPGHQTAYMYPWAGEAWKTQNRVREILNAEYTNEPGGLSGNDDVGQMSAWAVLSMAGFYPVCPGTPEYIIGSPVFDNIRINLPNGESFIIETKNNSDTNRFIKKAKLNGKNLDRAFITHDEITSGGHLVLEMSSEPNKEWALNELPFSVSKMVSENLKVEE